LTQYGDVIDIIKKNDLYDWIQNIDNELEIVELCDIISLYDVLKLEQKRRIDIVLSKDNRDDSKIIMTGINDLKDLDNNNVMHYKRINVETLLEDENYEVFGSIIVNNKFNIEDFCVKFGLYDVDGFSVMIKSLNRNFINISKCFVLWIIIGNPSKLSVFSP